jgi:hypothetical protein
VKHTRKIFTVNQTGSREEKLTKGKESYENPNWVGWIDMNIKEYNRKKIINFKEFEKNF